MKIIYHFDPDGHCAGFWVRKLAKHTDNYPIEYFEINYGIPFPFDSIQKDEQVFIVDYSIMPDEMEKLLKITSNVTWVDHHRSAIKRYEGFPHNIPGFRYDGIAGCELTYCYLSCVKDGKEPTIDNVLSYRHLQPLFSKYIGNYDVWTFKYGEKDVKAFGTGLMLYDTHSESDFWDNMSDYKIAMLDIINEGKKLLIYDDIKNAKACEHKGFECMFEGYLCYALNKSGGTDTFKSVDQDKYAMFICFTFDGEKWTYSLRSGFGEASKDVNVSEIAMRYGGGGHMYASGFSSDELLLSKLVN